MEHYEECEDQIELSLECICSEINSKYEDMSIDAQIENLLYDL